MTLKQPNVVSLLGGRPHFSIDNLSQLPKDEHRIRHDDEGNGHAPLESDTLCNVGPQAGIELRFRLAYK
jgi:hypothetical protein